MGDLIPVMTTLEHEDVHGIPQLADFLGLGEIPREDLTLPQFYLFHGRSGETTAFPYSFNQGWAPSAEYVHYWAIEEALQQDISFARLVIEDLKDPAFEAELDEAARMGSEETEELLEFWKHLIERSKDEAKLLQNEMKTITRSEGVDARHFEL